MGRYPVIEPAKEWKCDTCGASTIQTGPRALELLPTPPDGWTLVDTTRILPPRVTGDGQNKVKVGASRETIRKVYCVICSSLEKK